MSVTRQTIGTGITKRPSITVHFDTPCGEEDLTALHEIFEGAAQTSTFEAMVVPWEIFCQNILAEAKLPPWNKTVRVYPDSNVSWADDLPEDWDQRIQTTSTEDRYQGYKEIFAPGEFPANAQHIAELRCGIDSQEWFAAKILKAIDLVRRQIACDATTTVAHLTLDLGMEIATAQFKFTWESYALAGQAASVVNKRRNRNSAAIRGKNREEQKTKAREEADRLWKKHLDWDITDVARNIRIQKKVPDSAKDRTIKYLKESTIRGYLKEPATWSTTYKPRK